MLTYAALSSNLWERAGFEAPAARDEIVVLSGAKDLWNFFPAHEAKIQKCLNAGPHASHFVAVLRSTF
ncbi:MAG: hypothetical protein DME59_16265 [Verrucomicrobia bacterium]|nr:MAG: hypothetical protein DME59_16265 [Verrucomicrobiota bacterium]PYL70782.1 MAG: hypothetical protein DMF26_21015 [Verrucomicrobiota bacterium]